MRFPWVVALLLCSLLPAQAATDELDPARLAPAADTPEAIRATLAMTLASAYVDVDGDKLFDSLEARYMEAPIQPVIVTFVEGTDVATAMLQVAGAGPIAPRYVYHNFGGFAADLDEVQARAIAALPFVRQVEWSQPGVPELDTSTYTMNVDAVQEAGIDGGDGNPDLSGNETLIAILDTGFDGQHLDLKGRFARFIDWSDGGKEKEPYDSGSHGTHVAGIAAGTGAADERFKGVAPDAGIVGFLISSSDTKGAAIASIDYLLERRDELPVRVLTISFGFGTTIDGTDALELAMDKAWEAGITNFKSTGNSGPNRGTVTVPGGARGIIGTASMFEPGEGGFRLSSFSSRGPTADGRLKPDIAAPGSNIDAANVGTGDGYTSKSGTSMASPFAAGVATLMFDADPSITPDDVRRIMAATAIDWGTPGHDIDYGHGRLDALAAVQQVLFENASREPTPMLHPIFTVEGASNPFHAHGTSTANRGTGSFVIEDISQPLAVTIIANHSANLPLQNGFLAVVRDPDGLIVATVSAGQPGDIPSFGLGFDPAPARQQTVAVVPTKTGTYTLELLKGQHQEMLWDVSAGLPAPLDVPVELPALEARASGHNNAVPGLGVLALLGTLLAFALRRR